MRKTYFKSLLIAAMCFVGGGSAFAADVTAKVGIEAASWGVSGLAGTGAAPAITTSDGRTAQLAEKYETTVETTGTMLKQTVTGLTNGTYTVTVCANAMYTSGRGFTSSMSDGATDVAYVYASNGTDTKKTYITAKIAISTTANGEYAIEAIDVTDGTLEIGLAKDKAGTNWETIQIKSLVFTPNQTAYESILAEAKAAQTNTDYTNIPTNASERTALDNAVSTYGSGVTDYETAYQTLSDALTAFTAAKDSYDAFKVQADIADALGATYTAPTKASDVASALQAINVAEYNAVTKNYTSSISLGEWTKSATNTTVDETKAGEHWDGTKTTTYVNQTDAGKHGESNAQGWAADTWSMSLSQEIELPVGKYVFKASGRRSVDAVLKVVVKDADGNVINSVSDFLYGNAIKGINTSGEASYDGTNFANDGKGFGWQWRFVPFTLDAATKVTISVEASTEKPYNWASFSNYTVEAIPSTDASKTAYTQAYNAALTALKNTDYDNVKGSERTALAAYNSTPTGTTIETIDAETTALEAATKAFTDAKANYDLYVTTKAAIATLPDLSYASSEKKTAAQTAYNNYPKSASDASTKVAAIRAYYESNAAAEGVESKTAVTIANAKASTGTDGWTTKTGMNPTRNDGPYTTSDGTQVQPYFDSNIYNKSNGTQAKLSQTLTGLASGKYLLSAVVRASTNWTTLQLFAGDQHEDIQSEMHGSEGQVFGNGWNYYYLELTTAGGSLEIGVNAQSEADKKWFSVDNFQLIKIGELDAITLDEASTTAPTASTDYKNVTLKRTFATGWNSVVLPFDTTPSALGASEAAQFTGTRGTTINFTKVTELEANKPYLVYFTEAKDNPTFNGVAVAPATDLTVADNNSQYNFVGTYTAIASGSETIKAGDYIVVEKGIQKAAGKNALKAFRAYFQALDGASEAKTMNISIDGSVVTGIEAVAVDAAVDAPAYNLAGQRVGKSYKGVVIVNGKKVIRK